MSNLTDDIVERARSAVAHDPEVNISLMGVRTIIEVADSLRHKSSEGADGWQDISTAPKDETVLLAKFTAGRLVWMASGEIWKTEGWCNFTDDTFEIHEPNHHQPTHWRPLPTRSAMT